MNKNVVIKFLKNFLEKIYKNDFQKSYNTTKIDGSQKIKFFSTFMKNRMARHIRKLAYELSNILDTLHGP